MIEVRDNQGGICFQVIGLELTTLFLSPFLRSFSVIEATVALRLIRVDPPLRPIIPNVKCFPRWHTNEPVRISMPSIERARIFSQHRLKYLINSLLWAEAIGLFLVVQLLVFKLSLNALLELGDYLCFKLGSQRVAFAHIEGVVVKESVTSSESVHCKLVSRVQGNFLCF
jgi:hypothetical protein